MIMRRRHFTLLELLVAAIGSAVLMAALLVVLNGAWRLESTAAEREDAGRQRDVARQRLQRDLSATVAPVGLLRGVFLATVDETGGGRHDILEFVSAVGATNDDVAGGDLVSLRYELVEPETGDTWNLVRTENHFQLAVDAEDAEVERTILRDVATFSLSFYDGEDWVDGWDAAAQDNALATAIRVRLEFAPAADGTTPLPLELVVTFHEAGRETLAANTGEVAP